MTARRTKPRWFFTDGAPLIEVHPLYLGISGWCMTCHRDLREHRAVELHLWDREGQGPTHYLCQVCAIRTAALMIEVAVQQ